MSVTQVKSNKGFKYAILCLALILMFIILQSLANSEVIGLNLYSVISGVCILLIFFFSIAGFIFSIKGIKDPNSYKKGIGLVVNSILIILLIITIVTNILDITKSLN
ncbi:hypothetical protein [Ichthyenterobacterium magnum]|uniref:Uncharacterized protein n=1 Tax=Ichthyenterobacterium magnum TaxID=1230530 RepID=A0A420DML0_9FLAO|nr:hypothetical protein [Ichthyenterobacterium magnum]RKE95399.1 hypothetical protein BXY80_1586 [Ichthyenterobacterium magnum]